MRFRILTITTFVLAAGLTAVAGERTIIRLKDFCSTELRTAGFTVADRMSVHIRAVGAAREKGARSGEGGLFAAGWIINADTRAVVWRMDTRNASGRTMERRVDERVTLERGSYEAYYAVPVFAHESWLMNFSINMDHREEGKRSEGDGLSGFFRQWFGTDLDKEWKKRCGAWQMELAVAEGEAGRISSFTPPRAPAHIVFQRTGLGEHERVREVFAVTREVTLTVYAIGEGLGDGELVDGGYIVNAATRERIWDMTMSSTRPAGGATKNRLARDEVRFAKGTYVLYYNTDDSHSPADWNDLPPADPLNWGITITARSAEDAAAVTRKGAEEFTNVIVRLVKPRDSESRSQGFTLTRDASVRVYAIGERSNARRFMADYATIVDARTRAKVWTMDVDRARYAGGASKNVFVDEVITLPRGSYVVTYVTDDSHSPGEWNTDPPHDVENYGVTVTGAGDDFSMSIVEKYVEKRDRNILAQIVRVGNDAKRVESFTLDRTTRVRIYALGEGQNRQMYDYGWIEDARTGSRVWEMTYGMTFHGGGHRKNRMVNTAFVLERGSYRLHYESDDSHSYNDWNVDQPEDPEFWGITVYRDEEVAPPAPPATPKPPKTPAPPGTP